VESLNLVKSALTQLGFLALVGLGALVLIGPVAAVIGVAVSLIVAVLSLIIALAAILLPFVLLGFLFWLPVALIRHGTIDRQRMGQWGSAVHQKVVLPSARCCAWTWRRTGSVLAVGWAKCRGLGRTVAGVTLETICGATILGGLAWLVAHDVSRRQMERHVLVGVLLGALFGLIVGLANYWPSQRPIGEDRACES
jgi:hypothetical protein